MDDSKKYNHFEDVLHKINTQIMLDENEKKRNNSILRELLQIIEEKLKDTDSLFKALYTQILYCGSFFDGLKVKNPDEYDLDLCLKLPGCVKPVISTPDVKQGFIDVKLENLEALDKDQNLKDKYRGFKQLYDLSTSYLNAEKVLRWMQSILQKACMPDGIFQINIPEHGEFLIKICITPGSPAFTLKMDNQTTNIKIHVDLVPCFVLEDEFWPPGYRSTVKHEFCIVPKYPIENARYWRPSFQEQERILINNKQRLKPALRLLKKLRDTQEHNSISSYILKTIVMLEVDTLPDDFWEQSLSYVFIKLLYKYSERLKEHNIPYYWNPDFNLLSNFKESTTENWSNNLFNIIKDIEKNLDNPKVIIQYLLTSSEQRAILENNPERFVMDSSDDESDTNLSYSTLYNESEIYRNNSGLFVNSNENALAIGIGAIAITGVVAGAIMLGRMFHRRND